MNERLGIANLFTALVFGAVLVAVAWASLAGPWFAERPLEEKRELAGRPAWGSLPVSEFPSAWEDWFNDHFGYRPTMIRASNLLRLKLWGRSTVRRVLPGRGGWLFYDGRSDRGGDPRSNFLGQLPDNHENLFADLQSQLEYTRDHFAAQGIEYLLVVVPDKWSLYPEHLPSSVGVGAERTSTDLLLDHLRENSSLEVLDLKPVLRRAAAGEQVYYRLDTHWNDRGAYLAACAIAERVAGVDPPRMDLFEARKRRRPEGDLVEMLGLEGWLVETETRLVSRDGSSTTTDSLPSGLGFPNPNRFPVATSGPDADGPRLLMLRDSFGNALIPFLAHSFAESRILWTSNHSRRDLSPIVEELGPDVVIELRAEKLMLYPNRYYLAPGKRAINIHPGKR